MVFQIHLEMNVGAYASDGKKKPTRWVGYNPPLPTVMSHAARISDSRRQAERRGARHDGTEQAWIPACAGMTGGGGNDRK